MIYGEFQLRHRGKLHKCSTIVLRGKMIKGCSIYCEDTKIYEDRGINNAKRRLCIVATETSIIIRSTVHTRLPICALENNYPLSTVYAEQIDVNNVHLKAAMNLSNLSFSFFFSFYVHFYCGNLICSLLMFDK